MSTNPVSNPPDSSAPTLIFKLSPKTKAELNKLSSTSGYSESELLRMGLGLITLVLKVRANEGHVFISTRWGTFPIYRRDRNPGRRDPLPVAPRF